MSGALVVLVVTLCWSLAMLGLLAFRCRELRKERDWWAAFADECLAMSDRNLDLARRNLDLAVRASAAQVRYGTTVHADEAVAFHARMTQRR